MWVWNWLVTSSSDPKKKSLALLGVLTMLVPKLMAALAALCALGIWCVALPADGVNNVIQLIVIGFEYLLYFVGGIMTIYGLGRKVYYTRWSAPQIPQI